MPVPRHAVAGAARPRTFPHRLAPARSAAGALENHRGTLAGWIAGAQDIKPGNSMPSYGPLPRGEDLLALATWLEGLR
jgi:cytochrome c oxidase subunit 2